MHALLFLVGWDSTSLAVIGNRCDLLYNYFSTYHTKDYYVNFYAGNIIPLEDHAQWKVDNYWFRDYILPTRLKRQQGKPKKMRRRSRWNFYNQLVLEDMKLWDTI